MMFHAGLREAQAIPAFGPAAACGLWIGTALN